MEMSLNVASPLTAATANVPDNVPLPGLLLIANVILSVAVGTRFTPGPASQVGSALLGSTLKTSCVAVPTVMSKLADVAVLKPPAVASNV